MKCFDCNITMKTIEDRPYHYKESGLDNVYLYGVAEYKCSKCGKEMVRIPRMSQLHIVLAIVISAKPERLAGAEIRFMRKEIGMTGKAFAEAIGVTPVSLSRWENEETKHSDSHDRLIRYVFRDMMQKRLQTMIDHVEDVVKQSEVVSIKKKRMDVHTDQIKYISIPGKNICECASA